MKLFRITALLCLATSLAACGSLSTRERNTVTGAVIGGVAGAAVTGSPAGTAGGAAIGGVIGNQIDRN